MIIYVYVKQSATQFRVSCKTAALWEYFGTDQRAIDSSLTKILPFTAHENAHGWVIISLDSCIAVSSI